MSDADDILNPIIAAVVREWGIVGDDITGELKARLSVPVERDEDGRVVKRSVAGEYPCMESGKLREAQTFDVVSDADTVTLKFVNETAYAPHLEHISRHITDTIVDEFTTSVTDAAAKGINNP